eukprot:ANDGO_00674.mRNA.1 Plancitoxin-1
MSGMLLLLVLSVSCCFAAVQASSLGCISDSGSSVEWWIMYKLPRSSSKGVFNVTSGTHHGSSVGSEGFDYAYTDSRSSSSSLRMSSHVLTDADSALATTLNVVYKKPSGTGWVFYNDETPDGKVSSSKGHTKGVFAFSASGGFWLVQSTPRFPQGPSEASSFTFPADEVDYGQTYLCISVSASSLDDVGQQLLYNQPQVYDSNMPSSLASTLPNTAQVIAGQSISQAGSHVQIIEGTSGTQFISFAKNKQWAQMLYEDLVAPYFTTPLYVETWMRPYEPSCCGSSCKYAVVNVQEVQLGSDSFKETQDHAKWAVSQGSAKGITCIGDINHMTSQANRGGGTVCIKDATLWQAFSSAITAKDTCSSSRK